MSQTTPLPPQNTGWPTSLPELSSRVYSYSAQFPTNLYRSLTKPSLKEYIRLVAIVGTYLLLRPWIEKFFAWWMDRDLAKSAAELRAEHAEELDGEEGSIDPVTGMPRKFNPRAKGAGVVRGQKVEEEVEEVEEVERIMATVTGAGTGVEGDGGEDEAVRRRQQQQRAALLEAYEREQKGKKGGDKGKEGYDPVLLEGWDY